MAASFKIPTNLKRKAKKYRELSKLEWKLFEKEKKLGFCTFWSVYLGKYKGKPEKEVTKKNNVESIDSKSCCVKETALFQFNFNSILFNKIKYIKIENHDPQIAIANQRRAWNINLHIIISINCSQFYCIYSCRQNIETLSEVQKQKLRNVSLVV